MPRGTADAAYVMDNLTGCKKGCTPRFVWPRGILGHTTTTDDKSLAQLDDTATGRCIFRAYGLPTTSRKSVRMYVPLALTSCIPPDPPRSSCVRFVAKLARDTGPIRKVPVEQQQQLTARTPPPASHRLFKHAQQDFARVMASPDGNPFLLLLRNAPSKGQGSLTKHRLQSLVRRVKWNLQQEQTTAL